MWTQPSGPLCLWQYLWIRMLGNHQDPEEFISYKAPFRSSSSLSSSTLLSISQSWSLLSSPSYPSLPPSSSLSSLSLSPSASLEHNRHIHCSHHHHRNCFPNMKKKSRNRSTSLTGTTMARSATDLCRWRCIQFRQQKSESLHRKCFCKMFSYLNS